MTADVSLQRKRGCLGFLAKLLRGMNGAQRAALPYRRKDYLLTRAERAFYDVLVETVDGAFERRWLVFAKVRLLDLLWLPRGTQERRGHLNRVQSKHVDFVLCDRSDVRPVLAIELDDSSHDAEDRRERDAFVDAALRDAGLPLLRVKARRGYDRAALALQLAEAMGVQPIR
jgi:hypothetical protein